jgi:hypothetical protein
MNKSTIVAAFALLFTTSIFAVEKDTTFVAQGILSFDTNIRPTLQHLCMTAKYIFMPVTTNARRPKTDM